MPRKPARYYTDSEAVRMIAKELWLTADGWDPDKGDERNRFRADDTVEFVAQVIAQTRFGASKINAEDI